MEKPVSLIDGFTLSSDASTNFPIGAPTIHASVELAQLQRRRLAKTPYSSPNTLGTTAIQKCSETALPKLRHSRKLKTVEHLLAKPQYERLSGNTLESQRMHLRNSPVKQGIMHGFVGNSRNSG